MVGGGEQSTIGIIINIYNKYAKTNKKVFMYEPCDELKTMMYSRSFQLLKKYMDYKRAKKEKKNKKISEQTK